MDKALNGGIPKGKIVLVAGGTGTGKSTLCLQFAVNGAGFGERTLYVSTEQNKEELVEQADGFGWNLVSLEKKKKLKIVYFDVTKGDSSFTIIAKFFIFGLLYLLSILGLFGF